MKNYRKLLLIRIGQKLCDFGIYIFSLGPKDGEDRALEKKRYDKWRELEEKRKANAV